jgi:hypothetical protein
VRATADPKVKAGGVQEYNLEATNVTGCNVPQQCKTKKREGPASFLCHHLSSKRAGADGQERGPKKKPGSAELVTVWHGGDAPK